MRQPRLIAVDDDQSWIDQVPFILESICEVETASNLSQAYEMIKSEPFDILLLDLNFEGEEKCGLDFFKLVKTLCSDLDVVLVTAETDLKRIVGLFDCGVKHVVPKPASPEEIRRKVNELVRSRVLVQKAQAKIDSGAGPLLIGQSAPMQRLRSEIARVVTHGTRDILLTGETGTGKDVVARLIHREMSRQIGKSPPFIPIHCGAISEHLIESELFGHVRGAFTGAVQDKIGAFEAAQGGVVFLDEIGEMALSQQPKLLRVLQERRVIRVGTVRERDVSFRTISATHVGLAEAIENGRFRRDLYYRIARDTIEIPSLRDRVDDIPELIYHFLQEHPIHRNRKFTDRALFLLQEYSWPGNVRQLSAVTESLASRCSSDLIRESDVFEALPELEEILRGRGVRVPLSVASRPNGSIEEKRRIKKALIQANQDRDQAAHILGVSRATLFRRLKAFDLVGWRA